MLHRIKTIASTAITTYVLIFIGHAAYSLGSELVAHFRKTPQRD